MFYRVPAAFWVAFHGVCTAISVRLRDAFGVCRYLNHLNPAANNPELADSLVTGFYLSRRMGKQTLHRRKQRRRSASQ